MASIGINLHIHPTDDPELGSCIRHAPGRVSVSVQIDGEHLTVYGSEAQIEALAVALRRGLERLPLARPAVGVAAGA